MLLLHEGQTYLDVEDHVEFIILTDEITCCLCTRYIKKALHRRHA